MMMSFKRQWGHLGRKRVRSLVVPPSGSFLVPPLVRGRFSRGPLINPPIRGFLMSQDNLRRVTMQLKTRLLALVLFATLSGAIAPAQTTPAGPPQDLDAFAARVLKEFEVPGLAVAIVKDGKVVLAKGYG